MLGAGRFFLFACLGSACVARVRFRAFWLQDEKVSFVDSAAARPSALPIRFVLVERGGVRQLVRMKGEVRHLPSCIRLVSLRWFCIAGKVSYSLSCLATVTWAFSPIVPASPPLRSFRRRKNKLFTYIVYTVFCWLSRNFGRAPSLLPLRFFPQSKQQSVHVYVCTRIFLPR